MSRNSGRESMLGGLAVEAWAFARARNGCEHVSLEEKAKNLQLEITGRPARSTAAGGSHRQV